MKAKKNPESEGNVYRYIYEDSEGNTREEIIIPGKDGVKDEHIEMLKCLDGKESYNDEKNRRPILTPKEKKARNKKMNESANSETQTEANISIDYCMEHKESAEARRILAQISYEDDDLSPDTMRLRELISELSDFDIKIYNLVLIGGYSHSEAAKELNVSKTCIEKHRHLIVKYIKDNFGDLS